MPLMSNILQRAGTIAAIAITALTSLYAGNAHAQDKVIYHIDNAEAQATKGLRNIRNHLDVAPDTKIIVVTHADGVDMLFEGAKDKKNPMWTMARSSAHSRHAAWALRCAKSR
jgi:hypothetical protein